MKRTILISSSFLLLSTSQVGAQMKSSVALSHTMIKSKYGMPVNQRALPAKNAGKSTAKTLSSLRLYAIANYDLSTTTPQRIDSTHYSYNATRGWGTDQPVKFDEAHTFETYDTHMPEVYRITQTFDALDNILTCESQQFGGGAYQDKSIYTYDAAGNIVTQAVYLMKGSSWVKYYNMYCYYSGISGPDSVIRQFYAPDGTKDEADKIIYTYNAKGNEVNSLRQMQAEPGGDWFNLSNRARTFDMSGTNMLKEVEASYSLGAWNEYSVSNCTYDASGNRLTEQTLRWNDGKAKWMNSNGIINTYDASGLLKTVIKILWNDYKDPDTTRSSYSYNSSNLIDFILNEDMDETAHTFTPSMRTVYYYDAKATSIATINRGGSLSIYPVPANDQLTLDLQWDKVQKATVSICDLQGRVWQQWTLPTVQQYKEKVALSNLPSGNYVLRISGNENARVTQQFTVVR